MKKDFYIPNVTIIAFMLYCFALLFTQYTEKTENSVKEESNENIELYSEIQTEELEVTIENSEMDFVGTENNLTDGNVDNVDILEQKQNEYISKLSEISNYDTYDWYIKYKELNNEYCDYIEREKTIYDVYGEDELELLFRIVETEVRDEEHFASKVNVASVIFNRINSPNFPNTIEDVLTQKNQFSGYKSGIYKKVSISNMTISACEYAFLFGDTTKNALYFDSTHGKSWAAKNREYIFTDEIGHNFYK